MLLFVRQFFTRFAPLAAIRDLRALLHQQKPHHVVFLVVSIMLVTVVLLGFTIDSHVERPYKRDIVYFQNWRADRTDAEIRAGQMRDFALKTRTDAAREKFEADRKAGFKRLDDKLEKWGI